MLRGRFLLGDSSSGDDDNFDSLISIGVPAFVVALLVLALRLQLPQRLYAFVAEGCKTAQTRAVEGGAFFFALADALQLSKTHYASMDSAGGKTLKSFADGILSCLFWQPPLQSGAAHARFTPLEPLPSMLHREFIKMQHLCRRGEPIVMAPAAAASSSSSGGGCCRGDGEEPLANRVVRCLAEAIVREEVIERACTTRRNRLLEWFVGGVLVHDLAQGPSIRGRVLHRFLEAFHAAGGDDRVLFVPPDPCSVLSVKGGVLRGLAPSAMAVDDCDFMKQGQHLGVDVSFECSATQHAVVTVDGVQKSSFTLDEVARGVVHVARTLPSAKLSSTELHMSTVTLHTVCKLPGAVDKSAPSALAMSFELDAEYELQAMSAYWKALFKTQQVRRLSSDRPVELSAVFQSLQLVKNAVPAAAAGAGDPLNTTTGSSRDGAVTGEGDEIEPVDMFKGLHGSGQRVVIGDAGMGKTTLLKYLAYVWADGNCPALSGYEHVFSVTLNALERYFKLQGAMRDGTASISSPSHASAGHVPRVVVQWLMQDNAWGLPCVDPESVAKLLADMDGKVLWLIDGVDEIQLEEGRSTAFQTMVLEPLLQSTSTVVTSRPMLRWVDDFAGTNAARYIIKGLSFSARDAFVQSYVCDYYKDVQECPHRVRADHILQRLLGEPSLQTFSRNPCLLEAVCCLAVEGKLPVMGAVRLSDIYGNFTAVLEHRGFYMCTANTANTGAPSIRMGNERAAKPWSARGAASGDNRATLRAFIGSVARHTWENNEGGNPVVQPEAMQDAWKAHGQNLLKAGLSKDTLPRLGFLRPEQTGVAFGETHWCFLHKSLLEWYTAVYLAAGLHTGEVNKEDLERMLKVRGRDIVWPLFFGCVFDKGLLENEYSDAGEEAALRFIKRAVEIGRGQPSVLFTLLGEIPPLVALGKECLGQLSEDERVQLIQQAIRKQHARAACLLLQCTYHKSKKVFLNAVDCAAQDLLERRHQRTLESVFQNSLAKVATLTGKHNELLNFQTDFAAALIKAYCDAHYSVTEHCGRHPMADDVRHRMKQLLAKGSPENCDVTPQLFLFGCGEGDMGLVRWCLGQGACDPEDGSSLAMSSIPPQSVGTLLSFVCVCTGLCFACGRGQLETVKQLTALWAIAEDDHGHTDTAECAAFSLDQAGTAEQFVPPQNAYGTNAYLGAGAGAPPPRGCQEDNQLQQLLSGPMAKAKRGEALEAACRWGHLDMVNYLLSFSSDQLVATHADRGDTVHRRGRMEVLRELLALSGDWRCDVQSAFQTACQGGHLDVVRQLLGLTGDRRVNIHADGRGAFRSACLGGHVHVVRELLGLTGDQAINLQDALKWACQGGHLDVVRELLGLTGDRAINLQDALRWACQGGHLDVVRELLGLTGDRAIHVRADNESAFRWACLGDHVDVVRELLGLTGDRYIDVHVGDEAGFRSACANGCLDVVRELLSLTGDRYIDVHADDDRAFRSARDGGHLDVVSELLGLTGDRAISVRVRDESALQTACQSDGVDVVRELLSLTGDRRIDVPVTIVRCFLSACRGGHLNVVRELLGLTDDRAISVHARRSSAFFVACCNNHVDVVRELLGLTGDWVIDVNADNESAFRLACCAGHVDVVRELLGLAGDRAINVHAEHDNAFQSACRDGHVNVVRLLLGLTGDRRIDVHAEDEGAFRSACRNGHVNVVRELLSLTGDRRIDVHAEDEGVFRYACERGRLDVVRELLGLTGDRSIDVHVCDEAAFRSACANGCLDVVRELLSLTGDRAIDVQADLDWDSALELACWNGHVGVVRELLSLTGDRRIDVHAEDEGAFRSACAGGHVGVVRELLSLTGDRRIDVPCAFRSACRRGHVDVVRELLGLTGDQTIDVHVDDDRAFRWACEGGHVGVVCELLGLTGDRRIDVHASNDDAFRSACRRGHVDIVRELLSLTGDRRIDVHAEDEGAFRSACEGGHVGVVCELLGLTGDRRIDVHASNDDAFRSACRRGHVDIVRELLSLTGDRRIDVHAEDEGAFRSACAGGHVGVVRWLLSLTGDRRIDVHAEDEGAFRSACEGGHLNIVRGLLGLTGDRRIDVHASNDDAFRSACRRGHVDVVRELLSLTGDRRIDVHAGQSRALVIAYGGGHIDIVQFLLSCTGDRAPRLDTPSLREIAGVCQRSNTSNDVELTSSDTDWSDG